MPLQFPCSQCEKTLTAAEDAVGQPIMCIHCGEVTHVPNPFSAMKPSSDKDVTFGENRESLSSNQDQIVQEYTPPISLRQIESQTGWAIIVTLCFMPIAIFGMIFGSMAKTQFQAGHFSTAVLYYKRAKFWTAAAVILWIAIFLGLVFGYILPKLTSATIGMTY